MAEEEEQDQPRTSMSSPGLEDTGLQPLPGRVPPSASGPPFVRLSTSNRCPSPDYPWVASEWPQKEDSSSFLQPEVDCGFTGSDAVLYVSFDRAPGLVLGGCGKDTADMDFSVLNEGEPKQGRRATSLPQHTGCVMTPTWGPRDTAAAPALEAN